MPHQFLNICHDGDLYGSQQSLFLLVSNLPPERYSANVSLARSGPLNAKLASLGTVRVLSHKRLQWIKHDRRSVLKRMGDGLTLLLMAGPRVGTLVRHIRDHRIDCVHTNSTVSLEGALAAKIAGVPHVWHIRELFMEENPKLHLVLGRQLSRWIISRLSARVLCISQAVARQFELERHGDPEKFPVIYNALPPTQYTAAPSDNAPEATPLPEKKVFRLGYIGRLSAGKRFGDLLEAAAQLRRTGVAFEIVAAGNFVDADYERLILDQIATQGLQDCVHLLGYVAQTAPLWESMDIMVLPSLNEPFGRVLIEAMSAGVPCVAADSGGVPEIITHEETGWLYPPKDAAALAEQLRQLIHDPARLASVREKAGREARQRFTIETQIRMVDACYQSILPSKR